MAGKFVAPSPKVSAFTCPNCETLCPQYTTTFYKKATHGISTVQSTWFTKCSECDHILLWHDDKIVHPSVSTAPHPHQDLPAAFLRDYQEAASILALSPRGAAALLRYVIDALTIQLRGSKGGSLNERIGYLVEHKGLSPLAQQALDSVRVIGANAVHPLELDLRDDVEMATKLFTLINGIVEDTISRPKAVEAIYKALPPRQLAAIETRDGAPAKPKGPSKPDA
jgi:hypothetical protein